MKCKLCGREIADDSVKCEYCGRSFDEEEEQKRLERAQSEKKMNTLGCIVAVLLSLGVIGALAYGWWFFVKMGG